MSRELSDESVAHQAEAFLAYARKVYALYEPEHNEAAAAQIFERWCESKDFGPADRRAVAARVSYVLMRGRVRVTDVTGDGATEATASGEAA